MTLGFVRLLAAVLLVVLVVIYAWLTWRNDPRLATTGLLPRPVAEFFDLNPRSRNFPAFMLFGLLGGIAVAGLGPRLMAVSFALCVLAPVLKDAAQLLTATRHFNWEGTLLGILGAVVGWGVAAALLRSMKYD
jgi:hypothetical protein